MSSFVIPLNRLYPHFPWPSCLVPSFSVFRLISCPQRLRFICIFHRHPTPPTSILLCTYYVYVYISAHVPRGSMHITPFTLISASDRTMKYLIAPRPCVRQPHRQSLCTHIRPAGYIYRPIVVDVLIHLTENFACFAPRYTRTNEEQPITA